MPFVETSPAPWGPSDSATSLVRPVFPLSQVCTVQDAGCGAVPKSSKEPEKDVRLWRAKRGQLTPREELPGLPAKKLPSWLDFVSVLRTPLVHTSLPIETTDRFRSSLTRHAITGTHP